MFYALNEFKLFLGESVDLTIFPPVCLPQKGQDFEGTATVYGIKHNFFLGL